MTKEVFKDFENGLTVGDLKKLLESYPDDLKITYSNFVLTANAVYEGTHDVYDHLSGKKKGEKDCLIIN